ncbi:MAG: FtsX-like permease family protein [Vicinamibacteria bacterium]|nr:FtsX-like permease family protein [Vicinamibacteria bacterium]
MSTTSATPFILRLAFRNLSRHRRRTGLTIGALAFGIALMVLGQAWTDAMERAVVEPAKNATLGHVQIYRSDAAADETGEISFIMPQNNYRLISKPLDLIEEARRMDPRIESGLSRLMVGALLSFKDTTMDGVLIGIDARARAATYPALSVVEGRHFEPGEKGVLINRGVARRLGIGPGDDLVALGTTSDGRLNGTRLQVTGIYTIKGLEAYEWGSCYADLEGVQEILDVPGQAGLVVLRLKDSGREADSVRDRLNAAFKARGVNATAFTWEDMGGPFIGGMLVTRFIAAIMNFVMGVIVAAGVLNTVLMATFERTREMGTMRAMGARKQDVLSIFLSEGFLLGLFGATLGAVLGAATIVYFSQHGIPAFSEAQKYTYGGDRLFPTLKLGDVLTPPLIMLGVSVIASFVPSWSASRQRPAESLRYV